MALMYEKTQDCELLGLFGLFIQGVLGIISVGSLVVKKFLPGEKRTWKVFCLDIWKQLTTSLFAHFLNVFLSIYLQELTQEGNGCVWYFMNMVLDTIFGLMIAYLLFKIVDHIAVTNNIEVLKHGVYLDEKVDLVSSENKDLPDKHINFRIWIVQMVVWCMIVFLAKIVVFFFEIIYHRPIVALGVRFLSGLEGNPKIELVVVMIVFPVTLNSIQFWV